MTDIDASTLGGLEAVDASGIRPGRLKYFPDYLIVGPQRTGTTWLAKILWRHPEVFMSFPKELYFFNLLNQKDHRYYRSNRLRWYTSRFRDNPGGYLVKAARGLYKHRVAYRPAVRGEATASYAALDPKVINEIVSINPDVKIIVMFRDPVTRAWSHAKKDLSKSKNRPISDIDDNEFFEFFSRPYQLRCGSYSTILANWSSVVKPGNLFVGRFDEITTEPARLLAGMLRFLGVDPDPRLYQDFLHEKVNPTEDADMPERFRSYLSGLFDVERTIDLRSFEASRGVRIE